MPASAILRSVVARTTGKAGWRPGHNQYSTWIGVIARTIPDFVDMAMKYLLKFSGGTSSSPRSSSYSTQATLPVPECKLHKLESGPATEATVTKEEAVTLLTQMETIRRMETAAGNLYKEKAVRGFCHLYSGQEAIAVGMVAALRPQDTVITAYRAHGWTYLMGATPIEVLSELTGRKTGCARGKGGSMHMYTPTFFGGNGIVGAQVPLGAGLAFAHKYKGNGGVCLALFGDGAANQGQIYEAYNMAKLWDLPAIFICENNGYGMGTPSDRASASTTFYTRGDYVPGIWVDGMDVLGVREAMRYAVDYCTSGKGPLVMEAATYRYSGHSMSDPGTSYRTREEVQEVRKTRDPITSFKEKMSENNIITQDEIKAIEKDCRTQVDAAVKVAKEEKEIGMEELAGDVYVEFLEGTIRGLTPFESLQHKRVGPAVNAK